MLEGCAGGIWASDGIDSISRVFYRRRRRTSAVQARHTTWQEEHAKDLFTYEMLLLRELEQDAMLWQTPTIALTAQAFRLTIALAPDSQVFARVLAASLGLVVAALSMQLMAKHRLLESVDRRKLGQLEAALGIDRLSDRGWGWERGKYLLTGDGPKDSWFRRRKSYVVWQSGIAVFGLANLTVIAVAVVVPSWLTGP